MKKELKSNKADATQIKICLKCNQEKLLNEFWQFIKREKKFYYSYCKKCMKLDCNNYYKNNKEKILLQKKEYYNKNKEKISMKDKKYREKNIEKILIYHKKYNKYNKVRRKKYREKNKERIASYIKEYYKKNRNKINRYIRERKMYDMGFKIMTNLRRRIHKVLKGERKYKKIMCLVGCSIEELKQHLENQFQKGMTWSNYGLKGWVIDHIKPCSLFDLSKESEQKKCFSYKNLQPLWWYDNSEKRDKFNEKNKKAA